MPVKKAPPSPNVQNVKTVTAPIGGLNVRDPLSAMPETDAYEMINWIPQQYGLKARKGYQQWLSVGSDEIKSIMNYFSGTTSIAAGPFSSAPVTMPGKLFAATDAAIFDVTNSGTGVAASVATLSGNAEAGRFSWVNFTNPAGASYILACSETDGYYTYDGATWLKVTSGGGAGQITGATPGNLVHVSLWKNRAWFVERNSSHVWYSGTNALYGAFVQLDLGPFLRRGGGIAWIASWTIDAGEGVDDLIVFCSENGEVLIYKGTDPASSSTFALVGRWEVGQIPKGRRGYIQMGGDLLILSTLGISPLSYITRGGAQLLSASQQEYTSKIAPLFNEALNETFNDYGWGLHINTREGLLIVMSSIVSNGVRQQYVMNIANGSWTKFNNMDVRSIGSAGGWSLFGSSTGMVNLAFIGNQDNVNLTTQTGVDVYTRVLPAFVPLGPPAQEKHFLFCKINFLAADTPDIYTVLSVDFTTSVFTNVPTLVSSNISAIWDTATWDSDVWGGEAVPYELVISTPAIGNYASLGLACVSSGAFILTNISYIFEGGGLI